jgi:hypothetical protein
LDEACVRDIVGSKTVTADMELEASATTTLPVSKPYAASDISE